MVILTDMMNVGLTKMIDWNFVFKQPTSQEEALKEISNLYLDKRYSTNDISLHFNNRVSNNGIRDFLRKNNVPLRLRGGSRKSSLLQSRLSRLKFTKEVLSNMVCSECGQLIETIIKENNVAIKPHVCKERNESWTYPR